MPEKYVLSFADYAIFSIFLIASAAIGLYHQIFGGQHKTNNDYLFAGKDMSIFPVSISLMATFLSAVTLMGISTEMYLFGTNMAFMNLGFFLGPILASYLFLPIYFKTRVSTPYEYLEKRFGRTTRKILSVIFILQCILFCGISLYAPALALSAVTSLSMWASIISVGTICTFYCTLGGMKAVLWTDVFQSFLIYICLFSISIKGCLDLGGIQAIFNIAYDDGRIVLPTFKMDFSIRYTMWSIFLQSVIMATIGYGGLQTQVQRLMTLKNCERAKMSCFLSVPMLVSFQLLCCFCGIIFYVYYRSCDPVKSHRHPIESYDQMMPYYIVSSMGNYSGLPGLCIAGIFSASLSTISSGVNSMAAVTYEDIIRPIWTKIKNPVLITKLLSVFYGIVIILTTFIVASMGTLVKASVLVVGGVSGPILGLFLLASLTTTANEVGANIGAVAGFLFTGIISYITRHRYYPTLPIQYNCTETFTDKTNLSLATNYDLLPLKFTNFSKRNVTPMSENPEPDIFPVSYMWISPMSLLVCFLSGYFASWIISYIQGSSKPVSPEMLSPIRQRFYKTYQTVRIHS